MPPPKNRPAASHPEPSDAAEYERIFQSRKERWYAGASLPERL